MVDVDAARRVTSITSHVTASTSAKASMSTEERRRAMIRHIELGPRDLLSSADADASTRPWIRVTQEKIDAFADITHDDQYVHRADAPGGAIAHGFLTLALLTAATRDATAPSSSWAKTQINSGIDHMRFLSPVPADSGVRARSLRIDAVAPLGVPPAGVRVAYLAEIECGLDGDDAPRPCLLVRWVVRQYL